MATSQENFLEELQKKLPQTRIQWEQKPDLLLSNQFCSVSATCIADPSKKFVVNFDKGLGEPPLDDVIETFIEMFINDTGCR